MHSDVVSQSSIPVSPNFRALVKGFPASAIEAASMASLGCVPKGNGNGGPFYDPFYWSGRHNEGLNIMSGRGSNPRPQMDDFSIYGSVHVPRSPRFLFKMAAPSFPIENPVNVIPKTEQTNQECKRFDAAAP